MKILICTKRFHPENVIGAVRPTNIAKYLHDFGHQITVVTSQPIPSHQDLEGFGLIRVRQSWLAETFNKFALKLRSHPNPVLGAIFQNIKRLNAYTYDLDWYWRARRQIKRMRPGDFDIVISSCGPLSSLYLGRYAKRRKIARKWICDLRDNLQMEGSPVWLNKKKNRLEKEIYIEADRLTLVSHGQKVMFLKAINQSEIKDCKVVVIYNGYETNPASDTTFKKDNVLTFAYTGRLYKGKRDITLLIKALEQLVSSKEISTDHIRVIYAGNDYEVIEDTLALYPSLRSCIHNKGFISRKEAQELQSTSDILIALSWNTNKEQGILTGKFLEYLCSEKPIISITSGNLPDAEITKMVNEMNLGLAVEYVGGDKELEKLKRYILTQYNNKIDGNAIIYEPDREKIELFDYKNLIRKFEQLCLTLNSDI